MLESCILIYASLSILSDLQKSPLPGKEVPCPCYPTMPFSTRPSGYPHHEHPDLRCAPAVPFPASDHSEHETIQLYPLLAAATSRNRSAIR